MTKHVVYLYSLFFIFIAFIATVLLSINISSNIGVCVGAGGCNIVKNSDFSNLFGIPIYNYGLIGFFILSLVLLSAYYSDSNKKVILLGFLMISAFLSACFFIAIQVFTIKALCTYCMIVDCSVIISVLLFLFYDDREKVFKTCD